MFSIRLITNQGSWVMILPAGWVSMFSKYHVSGRVGLGRVGGFSKLSRIGSGHPYSTRPEPT